MEFNSNLFYDNTQTKNRGKHGFAIVITVLVFVLVAVLVLAIMLRDDFAADIKSEFVAAVETPTPTDIPQPVATPGKDAREMPLLDGRAPELSQFEQPGFWNNPIPVIFEQVSDSVVGVLNYTTVTVGDKELMAVSGSGSGFIISGEGYVLTNAHVIDGAEKVSVLLSSGVEIDAEVIGYDQETDIAVLYIAYEGLYALAVGDSQNIRVGEFVIAIGNPLETDTLANTTTFGVISAREREITIDGHTNTYLQTDAAINFGNSGGPLLNMKGEVIGMNSAKTITAGYDAYGNAVSAEGIGFALPIHRVCEIMERLITEGSIERPAVGITVYTINELIAAEMGLPFNDGVYVASVVTGGPASIAGIMAGDIIFSANGKEIKEQSELIDMINECQIGDTITVGIYRNGQEITCSISLGDKNQMDFNSVDTPQEN